MNNQISTAYMRAIGGKQNYNITFYRAGKQIGVLDFNGPSMTFEGDLEDSARVFFDLIAQVFAERLADERRAERDELKPYFAEYWKNAAVWCAEICDEQSKRLQPPGNGKMYGAAQSCRREIYKRLDAWLDARSNAGVTGAESEGGASESKR